MPDTQYLKIKDVASQFGVDRSTVFRWIEKGRIKAEKLPSGFRKIPVDEIRRLQKEHAIETAVKRILVIDDEELMLNTVCDMLRQYCAPIEIIGRSCGYNALIDIGDCKPDLIITDYKLKDITGLRISDNIKAHPLLQHTPVILISGIIDDIDIESTGVHTFLRKPFSIAALHEAVHSALQPRATE
jgi:excisionase family DNA binding protein